MKDTIPAMAPAFTTPPAGPLRSTTLSYRMTRRLFFDRVLDGRQLMNLQGD